LFGRFSITASSLPSRLTDHYSLATRFTSHVPRPTIVGVRRRCRAPNWVQHAPPARRQYAMKSYIRAHFRAFYPHPAHKSALRAEVAAHFLAPGKRGWSPLATVLPSHAPRSASYAVTSGGRSYAVPSPRWLLPETDRRIAKETTRPNYTDWSPLLVCHRMDDSCGQFKPFSPLAAARLLTIRSWPEALNTSGSRRLPDGNQPQYPFSP